MEGDERDKGENVESIGHHIHKIEVFLIFKVNIEYRIYTAKLVISLVCTRMKHRSCINILKDYKTKYSINMENYSTPITRCYNRTT